MKAIFLSDITTADGKYLEHFVFKPGTDTAATRYIFLREKPTRTNWAIWIDFWHGYTNTEGKLKAPLGNWINGTHQYGNGTTTRRTMIYNTSKEGGLSTSSQQGDLD